MAELADALDSKSGTRKSVWVRPPPSAPKADRCAISCELEAADPWLLLPRSARHPCRTPAQSIGPARAPSNRRLPAAWFPGGHEAAFRAITSPAPAIPPHSPTITAQRCGAERRQCCNAIHAIGQPINRQPNPKYAPGSITHCLTINRIQAALPRQARTNAHTVLQFLSPDSPLGNFTRKGLHRMGPGVAGLSEGEAARQRRRLGPRLALLRIASAKDICCSQSAMRRFLIRAFSLRMMVISFGCLLFLFAIPDVRYSSTARWIAQHCCFGLVIGILVRFLGACQDWTEARRIRREWAAGRLSLDQLTPEEADAVLTFPHGLPGGLRWPRSRFDRAICWSFIGLACALMVTPIVIAIVAALWRVGS